MQPGSRTTSSKCPVNSFRPPLNPARSYSVRAPGRKNRFLLNRGAGRFDPFPYSLLNVLVSLEAIVLTSFVLMTQNRMTHQTDRRAHLDLQVNLLAEQELTAILQMLYALCQKAGTCARVNDARVDQLLRETDIVQLAVALDKELPPE